MFVEGVNYSFNLKAVDLLMESECFTTFKTRKDVMNFLNDLLLEKLHHEAQIVRTDERFKLDMHDVHEFEDSKQPYVSGRVGCMSLPL